MTATTIPTADQVEHCRLAEQEVRELVGRLRVEGMDFRVIMAAIATATAGMVHEAWGGDAVPTWFARQAAMTMHLAHRAK